MNPDASETMAWFEWGSTLAYGSQSAITNLGSGITDLPVSQEIDSLHEGNLYHCRIVASNSAGITYGLDECFYVSRTLIVTTLAGTGSGSLADAVRSAYDGDRIEFAVSGTITPTVPLEIRTNLTIAGPGAGSLAVSGGNSHQVFVVNAGVTSSISGLTICNGRTSAGGHGGGISSAGALTLDHCVVTKNSTGTGTNAANSSVEGLDGQPGGSGGGIYNAAGGLLMLEYCTISTNSTGNGGNGGNVLGTHSSTLAGGNGGNGGDGAGILSEGVAILNHCTIMGNSTGSGGDGGDGSAGAAETSDGGAGGPGGYGGAGGGLYGPLATAALRLTNCTFTGNSTGAGGDGGTGGAPGGKYGTGGNGGSGGSGGSGGGIGNWGVAALVNCSFATNSVGSYGSGGTAGNGGYPGSPGAYGRASEIYNRREAQLKNTLVGRQTSTAYTELGGASTAFPFTSLGHNLIARTNGSAGFANGINGDIVGSDPHLGPLANNGGPTFTFSLLSGSPCHR